MQRLDAINETSYLSVPNAPIYRKIMRVFYREYEKMHFQLYKEDVYELVKGEEEFAGQSYGMAQLEQDLDALVKWKNLTPIQDPGRVYTIADYKNRQYRYTMSEYAVEIERMTVRLENANGHIGWSRAWLVCLYARLWDRKAVGEGIEKYLSGSVLGNLYNSHPPFQIDGNFGICAGVVEAIAQCRDGKIVLLPAVPDEWSEGSIREMRLRGGILLDMEWKKGEVHFCLTSIADQTVDVSFGKEYRKIALKGGQPAEGNFSV